MPGIIIIIIIGVLGVFFLIFFLSRKGKGDDKSKKRGGSDRNSIIKEANKRLAQNPKDPQALLSLAELYYRENDFEKAFKNYSLLIDLVATNPELDEFDITAKHALSAMKLKQYDVAYKNFVFARTLNQESFEVNYNLGYLEYMKKNYEKAASLLKKAREENPEHQQTLRYLGHSLFKLKKHKEASAILRKTVELEPDDKESLFALAQCYHEISQNDQAIQIFTHLRTDPGIGPMAALFSGTIKLSDRKHDEAKMDFQIGLRHEGIKPSTRLELKYRLAAAYIQTQDISNAVKLLKEIHEENPTYKDVSAQLSKYKELNSNKNLQTYLMSNPSEFVSLCRRIVENYFKKARTKILDISIQRSEYTDILAEVHTSKWEDLILYRFIRGNNQVGELVLRDLYSRLKDMKAGRGFCLSSGSFTDGAKEFVEARLIDLVDKKDLLKLLNSL